MIDCDKLMERKGLRRIVCWKKGMKRDNKKERETEV